MDQILRPENPVVQQLEDMLRAARAGRITSIGIVTVSPLGQYTVQASGSGEQVYLACDLLKTQLLASISRPQQLQRIGNG